MRTVLIAVGFVIAVNILGLAALVCIHVLMSGPDYWVSPVADLADVRITDAELELMCGPDDEFDWACELEELYLAPCAPDPKMVA